MKFSDKTKMILSFAFLFLVVSIGAYLNYIDLPMRGLPALFNLE